MTHKFLMAEALEGSAEDFFQDDGHVTSMPNMDKFSAGGFRPTEVPMSITPRELAIRKGLRLIGAATCPDHLYEIMALWADHGISIQVQNMDNRILALEETWEARDRRDAREAAHKANSRQAQYDALYDDLFARATGATTMAIVTEGDIIVQVGGMNRKHWRASDVKAMLGATETRLNGGRLEFVV